MAKLSGKLKAKARAKERLKKEKLYQQKQREVNNLIVKFDNPALKKVCEPVSVMEIQEIFDNLTRVIKTTKNGVGLAAPQLGIIKRAFILRPDPSDNSIIRVVVNPEIVSHSEETNTDDQEGCLSYPGVFCDVPRFNVVKLSYKDHEWKTHEEIFSGFYARIVQHEIDHLNGICRVGDYWRQNNGEKNDKVIV